MTRGSGCGDSVFAGSTATEILIFRPSGRSRFSGTSSVPHCAGVESRGRRHSVSAIVRRGASASAPQPASVASSAPRTAAKARQWRDRSAWVTAADGSSQCGTQATEVAPAIVRPAVRAIGALRACAAATSMARAGSSTIRKNANGDWPAETRGIGPRLTPVRPYGQWASPLVGVSIFANRPAHRPALPCMSAPGFWPATLLQ